MPINAKKKTGSIYLEQNLALQNDTNVLHCLRFVYDFMKVFCFEYQVFMYDYTLVVALFYVLSVLIYAFNNYDNGI